MRTFYLLLIYFGLVVIDAKICYELERASSGYTMIDLLGWLIMLCITILYPVLIWSKINIDKLTFVVLYIFTILVSLYVSTVIMY